MNKISRKTLKETIRLIVKNVLSEINDSETSDKMNGTFVNRGEVKLQGGLDPSTAEKIAKYHWDIMSGPIKNEFGAYDFKTRGDRWCCSVGTLDGKPSILSITTTPGRLHLQVGNDEIFGDEINEMTTTGAVQGYNIPAAFSRRGGSDKGVKGSAKLGYKLTPEGEKEMDRSADKLV